MERNLSELEGVCLGIINNSQPCTAYRVRRELMNSPSSHWRASAGSVYPLIARLEQDGYVVKKPVSEDGRGRALLTITRSGKNKLKKWIKSGSAGDVVASVTDPIRVRAFFLNVLNERERTLHLEALIDAVECHLAEATEHLEMRSESDDLYEFLGSLGAVKAAEARLEWLRIVHARVSGHNGQ